MAVADCARCLWPANLHSQSVSQLYVMNNMCLVYRSCAKAHLMVSELVIDQWSLLMKVYSISVDQVSSQHFTVLLIIPLFCLLVIC